MEIKVRANPVLTLGTLSEFSALNWCKPVTSFHFLSPPPLHFSPPPQRTSFLMIYVPLFSLKPDGKIVEKTYEESQPILYLAVTQRRGLSH